MIACWGEPVFLRRFHLAMTFVFLVQIPIALVSGLQQSISYLVFLSLWALVAGHWSAWQSVRVEVKQDEAN